MQGQTKITNAFQLGLLGGLGVLAAVVIGGAIQTLADIITYIAAAIFIALGLEPVVAKLEKLNLKRHCQHLRLSKRHVKLAKACGRSRAGRHEHL